MQRRQGLGLVEGGDDNGERVTVHGAQRNGDGVARAGSGFSPSPSRGRPGWGWGLAGIAAAVGKHITSQTERPGAARRSCVRSERMCRANERKSKRQKSNNK